VLINVSLNDIKTEVDLSELTIFQLSFIKGINIPCFCYHERLSIAGNCRMCLVQVNSGVGVSCALNLMEDMYIYTDNKRVRESREFILEFMLSNHPLDCPICDQGGECDLQDISLNYGTDRSRFYESKKRAVTNIGLGAPLIKTIMTRCIHCTRCVRFAVEVGDFSLGLMGRGLEMEIGNYIELSLDDVLSGNIIDLCPVGALTSMPYAFKARPWELSPFSNIDFMDGLAASNKVYIYLNGIKRVLPVLNEAINEDWLTNKGRFSYDSLSINRLFYPKLRLNNKLVIFSWVKIIPFLLNLFS
jgi:NADH dehydrogenase/NADH:ubiquinone oxidoreductase subunit G